MLVTLTVMVLVTVIALPALNQFIARNRLAAVSSDFMATLAVARTEAARAGMPVLVAANAGGATGNELGNGWQVAIDQNSSGSITTGDTVVRSYAALPVNLKFTGSTLVTFSASGFLTPATTLTFTLCQKTGAVEGVQITVPPSGLADATRITTCS